MTKVSLIFAAVLVVELLTACNRDLDRGRERAERGYGRGMGPSAYGAVVVRVNSQNPGDAKYANLDQAPSQQNFQQVAGTVQNWQPMNNNQVISQNQGYPTSPQGGTYFVQNGSDFVSQQQQGMQNQQGAQQPQGFQIAAAYARGGGEVGRGNVGCGYCNYRNYGDYGSHYYYPNAGVNYGLYNYLPTSYYNNAYWYYQPSFYYPTYYGYGYNYYIYTPWW